MGWLSEEARASGWSTLRYRDVGAGLALLDEEGRFSDVNPAACSILGRSQADLLGVTLAAFAADEASSSLANQLASLSTNRHSLELCALKPDGTEIWLSVTTCLVTEVGGARYWTMDLKDVSSRKRTEAALEKLALFDSLTGLPNHGLLRDRTARALTRHPEAVAVAYISVDRLRNVNESLGRDAGDDLLRLVAVRLSALAPGSTVARVSGGTFAVVIEGVNDADRVLGLADTYMQDPANHTYRVASQSLHMEFSTGVALAATGMTADDLLRNAEFAMNRGREAGGNQVLGFHEGDLEAVRRRLRLENDLRHAIASHGIRVVYQPVVTTKHQEIVAAEALARWCHPDQGEISPATFIALASRLGLNFDLTSQVLHSACRQVAEWKKGGLVGRDFFISVNLSAEDVVDPRLVRAVRNALSQSGVEPATLFLEVNETGFVRDTDTALRNLRAVRRLGVRLAVDDFGTGYSSLSYLRMFPVDAVKIDLSFISGLGRDPNATALVRGILSLTGALGLVAVAEGIENDLQLEALHDLGCPLAQGYYWSAPVEGSEFHEVARRLLPSVEERPAEEGSGRGWHVDERDSNLGWAVLDALPTQVAVVGAGGSILATNLAWKRFALENGGNSSTCGVGANYVNVCSLAAGPGAEDASLAARGLRAVLSGEAPSFALEYDCDGPNQRRRLIMLVAPVASGSGAAVVAHLDITDRHLAEAARAASESTFRGIFDQAPVGIVRLDGSGRVVEVNPALCSLSDRAPEELKGKPSDELFEDVPPGTYPAEPAGAAAKHQEGVRTWSGQRKIRQPNGSVRIVQVNDVARLGPDGSCQTRLATVEDVTERLQLAEELRRAREMEALGRLAGGIAHEINTPTQFISDNLSFLSKSWSLVSELLTRGRGLCQSVGSGQPFDALATQLGELYDTGDVDFLMAEVPEALAQSQEGVERVATIVRAMKAFGHPDRLEPEATDLNRLVTDTLTVARNELKYVAEVVTDLGSLPTVMCYRGAVGQVLLNLLVNAAYAVGKVSEASGRLGRVSVRTWEEDGGFVCAEVSDTGGGIPPDVLPHIFEPFFTTKPVGLGTGQGLALAWSTIVERHHGDIDVVTSASGTTFIIKLPHQLDDTGTHAPVGAPTVATAPTGLPHSAAALAHAPAALAHAPTAVSHA